MPNNFRLTGGGYFSKDGNDGNAGTDPNAAKATPQYLGNFAHIIGDGEYKGAFFLNNPAASATYSADSLVKFSLTGNMLHGNNVVGGSCTINALANSGFFYYNLNGFKAIVQAINTINTFNRCIFDGGIFECFNSAGTQTINLNNCVFKDVQLTDAGANARVRNFNYCQVFNSSSFTITAADSIKNTYTDAATTIVLPTVYFTTPATQFVNNNIQGKVSVNGTLYELKKDKAGNAIDPNPAVADLVTIDATVYDRGNFSQDPEHQDLSKGNYFAVDGTSPNLFADSTGLKSVGGVFKAITFKAIDIEFASPVSNDGLIDSGGDIVYSSSLGERLSQPLFFSSVKRVTKRAMNYGGLTFNSSEAIGSSENKNVIVPQVYSSGTAGRNPQRVYVVLFRFTDGALPVVDADWNNGNKTGTTAGQFIEMQMVNNGLDLRIDNNGNGTGSHNFDPLSASNIALTWGQIKLVIKEGI